MVWGMEVGTWPRDLEVKEKQEDNKGRIAGFLPLLSGALLKQAQPVRRFKRAQAASER